MAAVIRWNYGLLLDVYSIIIEKSGVFTGGTWTQIAEVLFPYVSHTDDLGPLDEWYRFKVVQSVPVAAEVISLAGDSRDLVHAPLLPGSEKVMYGVRPCIRDVDYTVDNATGTITRLVGGAIPADSVLLVDYRYLVTSTPTIPKQILDIPRCKVYGNLVSTAGYPVGAEKLTFVVVRPPQIKGNHILIAAPRIVETSADGYFEVDLYQGAVVRVQNYRAGLDNKEFVVPAVDAKNFRVILEDLA